MNLSFPPTTRGAIPCHRKCSGSVLVLVLWISIGLISIALYFSHAMTQELRAADNRASGLSADQAVEGAARYVSQILATLATNGAIPDPLSYQSQAVPIGEARFWLLGRDPASLSDSNPWWGLIDEGAKLNLNTADTNALSLLPNMSTDLADAIGDWRSTNSSGEFELNYGQAMNPYPAKHAPFETIDELRLVYGATVESLAGEDRNRNGVLDPDETDDNRNGQMDGGLLEYTTVYSQEPNTRSDGTRRVNLSNRQQLSALLISALGASRANEILRRLGAPNTNFRSPLQFYIRSGLRPDEFAKIGTEIAVNTNSFIQGRVNVNTASEAVLACLPGMDSSTAKQLINYRRSASTTSLASIAWIADTLGATSAAIQALQRFDILTTQSYQFTADIAAIGPNGRGYRRARFVFDVSSGTPQILHRQDLTRLGWALGRAVQEAYQQVPGSTAAL